MLIKFRRYCAGFPAMWRIRLSEFLVIICCAAILALVYCYINNGDTKSDETFEIRKIANVKLSDQTRIPDETPPDMAGEFVAAVLVICASRPKAIENHLNIIKRLRPSSTEFPVVISRDGGNEAVHAVVSSFEEKNNNVTSIHHDQGSVKGPYKKIAAHYKFALDYMFKDRKFDFVIVTEDDLELGNDFFSYFKWGRKLLESDPTIWCISAWNDNGTPKSIDSTKSSLTWRTDFFPGLGWMLSRSLWEELSSNFPEEFWDDWMRLQEVRKGRSCVRPEVPRTSHNMALAGKGSSGGLYKQFLSSIHHSNSVTDFSLIPIEGLIKENYDTTLKRQILDSKLVPVADLNGYDWNADHSYRIMYDNMRTWFTLAAKFGLMSDVRGGMARTVYHGVVTTVHQGCRVFIYPDSLNVSELTKFEYYPVWDKQVRYIEFQRMYCKPGRWTGVCDPYSDEMKEYFRKKGWTKRLPAAGTLVMV